MKTERRHELQKNDLADQLNRSLETVRPYSSTITVVLLVAVVVFIGFLIYTRQADQRAAEAWSAYFQATEEGRNAEKLQEVIEEYPNTTMRDWAELAAADAALERGTSLLGRDKHGARTHLTTAAERYRELVKATDVQAVKERAQFNLALTYESLGQLEEAREMYGAVGGTLAEVARARAAELEDKDLQQFYDWYAQAEPPASNFIPEGGAPGERPAFGVESPQDTPFRLPSGIDDPLPTNLGLPSDFGGLGTTTADDAPQDEATSAEPANPEGLPPEPADEPAPAAEQPSEAQPTGEAPATEQPAAPAE